MLTSSSILLKNQQNLFYIIYCLLAFTDKHNWKRDVILCEKVLSETSGGRLNKKDGLTRYGDSHVKDKTS